MSKKAREKGAIRKVALPRNSFTQKIEGISAFELHYRTEFHVAQLCECINNREYINSRLKQDYNDDD